MNAVIGIILIIWAGIATYLVILDRKLNKLEKSVKELNNENN